jgi:hypothetical protein
LACHYFFAHEEKNQEVTKTLPVCYFLLHLKKKPRDDDEPGGLSLSFAFEETNVQNGSSLSFSITQTK